MTLRVFTIPIPRRNHRRGCFLTRKAGDSVPTNQCHNPPVIANSRLEERFYAISTIW